MNLMEKPLVSIILPTYNERGNIIRLINSLNSLLDIPAELLVVDDNSPDGTADEVNKLSCQMPNLHLILRTNERGLTSAIQRGIDESLGEVVVWMDCDFSMPPETVVELVSQILRNQMDAAIGSKYVSEGSYEIAEGALFLTKLNTYLSLILNWIARKIAGVEFHDWTSGFIAIRSEIIKHLRLEGEYGEYFINLMTNVITMNLRYIEVPYIYLPRQYGNSKTTDYALRYIIRGLRYLPAVIKMGYLVRKSVRQRDLSS